MENVLNHYSFPGELKKAGNEKDGKIPIEIIPNKPSVDRVNDKILLKAFDDDCIKSFLKDGIIDYDHLSILGDSPLVKAQAIIGQPEELYIDKKINLPVCHAFLFKGNPYVDNAILPALESNSKVFGASLGGKILKKSSDYDNELKRSVNAITKITLKHIAITPLQKAVHQETSVKLRKSDNGNNDLEISFSSFEDFVKSLTDCDSLEKAMQAGSVTDIANISGAQSIQRQSLEGNNVSYLKMKHSLPFLIRDIINGTLSGSSDDYRIYLIERGFSKEEAEEIVKLIATNGVAILKLIF